MNSPGPRVRHGAHRSGHSIVSALMPSVLAVAAVAALITALAVWQGEDPRQTAGASASSAGTRDRGTLAPSASPSVSPSPTAAVSSAAEPTEAATSPAAEPTEAATSPAPTGGATPATPDRQVVVLNQTARRGLAGTVADRLREAGWPVPAVGNFRGVVPSTTVYYPDGARTDALAVAADLPTDPRVRPRFGNLSTTRLTVVVTDTYPS